MPVLGHGYGTASGQSAFDITSTATGSMPCISYMAHPDASTIHMGSPVVLSDEMVIASESFYPSCQTVPPLTIDGISTQISRGGASVGWPNKTSTTGDPCSEGVFGTLDDCAVSLTTTPGGSTGKAFVSARCSAYVLRASDAGDADGGFAHSPTDAQMAIAAGKSASISGALVRRHTGLWKILSTTPVYDSDGATDLGIDLCLLERQPYRHRWFVAEITGIDASSTDYVKYYTWSGAGISSASTSVNEFATNLVEDGNSGLAGGYVSDQEIDNIGDWNMLQTRGKVFMNLEIISGTYTAQFSRASQFMGDCWDL